MFTNLGSMGRFNKVARTRYIDVLDGLIARYNFEEGTGTLVADSSENSNDGTASGMTWETGKIGTYSGGFDGNDVVDFASLTNWKIQDFTVTTWINSGNIPGDNGCIASTALVNNSGLKNWLLTRYEGDGLYFRYGDGSSISREIYSGNATLPNNEWVHVAVSFDESGDVALSINGAVVISQLSNGIAYDSTYYRQSIGARKFNGPLSGTTDRYFDGKIDDTRIYNRALTAEEISRVYNKYA
jgi:hypothetical protein